MQTYTLLKMGYCETKSVYVSKSDTSTLTEQFLCDRIRHICNSSKCTLGRFTTHNIVGTTNYICTYFCFLYILFHMLESVTLILKTQNYFTNKSLLDRCLTKIHKESVLLNNAPKTTCWLYS